MSVGEFSGYSSDTAINPFNDEGLSMLTAELLSRALDHDVV
jgi:hypothetical protein